MVKKKAIMRDVLTCFIIFAILVSAMPVPVFAMNSSNNATEASNHSNDLDKSIILPLVSNDTGETVSTLSCDVYVKIDDDTCVGYEVYVDDVYQFTEGQDGTPDGYCAFYVSAGTHKFELRENGYTTSKSWYCQCGTVYIWVSMPDYWCECGGNGNCDYPPTVNFDKSTYYEGDTVYATVSTIHNSVYYEIKDCSGMIRESGYVRNGETISYTIPSSASECCYWEICFYWDEWDYPATINAMARYIDKCSNCYTFYVCPKTTCEVWVEVVDKYCNGYEVYVDGVYQFTEGQDGTPDGYCSFHVTPGTHKFELRKNGCSVSKSWYCQCGTDYSWVSMNDMDPHWCDSHQQKKEVTFSGMVTGLGPYVMGSKEWYVSVDEWISGSLPCDEIEVIIGIYPPMGHWDENINKGDRVDVYGVVDPRGGGECTVGLNGESYYIKKIETCGKILAYAITNGTYTLPQTVMAHMKYKNYMKSPTKFKGVFLVKNQRTGKIYSCSKEQITNMDDRFGYGKGNSLQIRFEDEGEDIGVYDAKLELRNFYTDELCDETEWLEDQFKIDDGEEIKFNGTAIEYQRLIDTCYWTVDIDNVISGPQPSTNQLNVITWSSDPGTPRGYVDPNIKEGDKVEVYGEYRGDGPHVLLEGSEDYYIKVLSYCTTKIVTLHEGEVLDFKIGEVFKNGEQPWSEYQMGFSGNEIGGECADFVEMGMVDICSSEPPPYSLKTYNLHHITPEVGHTYGVALGCPVKECIQIYIQACDGNSVTFEYEVEPTGLLVHNINTEKDFATIQAAIDDSDTEDGHTITVDPGTYNENIIVNKSIKLKGIGYPYVKAISDGSAIEVTADNCGIEGFKITGKEYQDSPWNIFSGIVVNSNKNTVKNNKILDNENGICLYGSNNLVSNNSIFNNDWDAGIYIGRQGQFESNNNTISNNLIHSNEGNGIVIPWGNWNVIYNNTIQNNSAGIFLDYGCDNNNIFNNDILNNRKGICIDCWSNNTVYLNNIIDNTLQGLDRKGNNFWNSTSKITYKYNGNTYINYLGNYWGDYDGSDTNNDGIGDIPYTIDSNKDNYPLMKRFENYIISTVPKIIEVDDDFVDDPPNHKWDTIQEGINDAHDGDTVIVNNGTYYENVVVEKSVTLKGIDSPAIDVLGYGTAITIAADACTIEGFKIISSGEAWGDRGVKVESNSNVIQNNTFDKYVEGILIESSSLNTLIYNTALNGRAGIILDSSNSNTINSNIISKNDYGIYLWDSSNDNTLSDNNVSNNERGIWLYDSSNNLVYHNNLINNTNQAYDNTGANSWDNGYPSGGNYWSDYEEKDAKEIDESGIWDIPYDISGGAKDNYPLMEPWGEKQLPSSIYPIYDYLNIDLIHGEIEFVDIKLYVGPNINSVYIKELDDYFQPDEQGNITLNHLHIYNILASGYNTTRLDYNGEEKKIDLLFSIDHLTDEEKRAFLKKHKELTGFAYIPEEHSDWEGEIEYQDPGDIQKGIPPSELAIDWKVEGQDIENFYSDIDEMLRILQFSYLLSNDADIRDHIKQKIESARSEGKLTDDCEIYNEIRKVMETMAVPVFSKENPEKCDIEIPHMEVSETYKILETDITHTDHFFVDEKVSLWITVDNSDNPADPGGVILHFQTNVFDLDTASGLIKMAIEAEDIAVESLIDIATIALILSTGGGAALEPIIEQFGTLNDLAGLFVGWGITVMSNFYDYSVDLSIPIIQEKKPEPISNEEDLRTVAEALFNNIDEVYFPLLNELEGAKGIVKVQKDALESNPVTQPIVRNFEFIDSWTQSDLNAYTLSLHFDSAVNPIEYERVITDIYQDVNANIDYDWTFEYDILGIEGSFGDEGAWNYDKRIYYPESYLFKVEKFDVSDFVEKSFGAADVTLQYIQKLAAKLVANIVIKPLIFSVADTPAKEVSEYIANKLLEIFVSWIVETVQNFVYEIVKNTAADLLLSEIEKLIPADPITTDLYMGYDSQPVIIPAPSNLFEIDFSNVPVSFDQTVTLPLGLASFHLAYSSDVDLNMEEGGTQDDSNILTIFAREYGEYRESGSFTVTADCPVDILVRNPDGLIFSKDSGLPLGCTYEEIDIDGDGEKEDVLTITGAKFGLYEISIIPEAGADPNEFFSLSVSSKGDTITLAENVKISEIPNEPYSIELTDTGVIDKELKEKIARKYMPTIYQLQCDIADPKDNGLIKVGYSIEENNDEARIEYNFVFKDEDDAYLDTPYDEFRKLKYGRIEDIEGFSTTVDLNMDKIKEIEFDGTWHNDSRCTDIILTIATIFFIEF